jgi:3-hydroxyisobutyrate dehydrogenase
VTTSQLASRAAALRERRPRHATKEIKAESDERNEKMTSASHLNEAATRVAVIGTGTMGSAMARRLLGARMEVHVWSRHSTTTTPLVELGAVTFENAPDAARDAQVLITMLPTIEATSDVMFAGGVIDAMKRDAVWVQMATVGVAATEWMARETRRRRADVTFVDAPVSGSREPAENGQLLILASGPSAPLALLESVFGVLGRSTLWLGSAGAGSRLKLVLNTWLAFQTEGAAEASALAVRLGVPSAALFDALRDNALASKYALAKFARMTDEDYHADFTLDWALKDLDLVGAAAGEEVAPIAHAIAERWRELLHEGSSGLDVSAARRGLGDDGPFSHVSSLPSLPDGVACDTSNTRQASANAS